MLSAAKLIGSLVLPAVIVSLAVDIAGAYTACAQAPAKQAIAYRVPPAPKPPKPLRFRIAFTSAVHTKYLVEGDEIEGVLKTDLKTDNDIMLAPAGSKIFGTVEHVNHSNSLMHAIAHAGHMHGSVAVSFNRIVLPDKSELDLAADAIQQLSVFSNGEAIREVQVGPGGTLLKACDTDLWNNQDFGFVLPKSWLTTKDRLQVDIEPGDEITLETTVPAHIGVSAVIKQSKQSTP